MNRSPAMTIPTPWCRIRRSLCSRSTSRPASCYGIRKLDREVSSLAIVADAKWLYLIDRTDERVYQRLKRRGEEQFESSIKAIELSTGETRWEKPGIAMSRKALSLKDGVLVAYPNPTEKESIDADTGVAVYSATDGELLWEETETPRLADSRRGHLNRYTFIVGDTLFLPDARELRTGRPKLLKKNPLTGSSDPFDLCGKNFCGSIAASRDLLAFRSASVGFQEVTRDSGSFWLPEIRPSCWISVVPAGGLVLAPEGYSTCICPYNYKTSLALVPVERHEDWSVYLSGRSDKRAKSGGKKQGSPQTELPRISQLRLNLNAPGDRMDADGHMWFAHPRPIARMRRYRDTSLPIEWSGVENSFRHNADLHQIIGTDSPWLYTSGVEGPVSLSVSLSEDTERTYDIRLLFAETTDAEQGDRIFDVKIQDKTVLSRCDIVADAGGANSASSFEIRGISARGTIRIELVPVEGKPPRLCAVAISEQE